MTLRRALRGADAYRRGIAAEDRVAHLFQEEGCDILARRQRTPFGEIDLIVADPRYLVFVEIKARHRLTDAAQSLSSRQAQRILHAATYCLETQPSWQRDATRFDLVIIDEMHEIRRIKDALRLM
ncbi:YraN family protein [Candidatus Kirkpatrickella diaphorinae]|uniref:UPF0102 protein N5W20_03125 n=1 Tax=Candidatus Kirkpatrickella diaphorinae TaxID=2984322 RepID=A0ABY6GKK8_9PROT|nr:YraN family protein [Candidatus Kirkpatrickella diaphorinae]UYH51867.1 YraN family protein [Candidatus Kirkpatrickella diaphorinae]